MSAKIEKLATATGRGSARAAAGRAAKPSNKHLRVAIRIVLG
jgi:hypothetical protein